MAEPESWRHFLEAMGNHDDILGVLVVDDQGSVIGRYGSPAVFDVSDRERDGSVDGGTRSQDVWMDEFGGCVVLVAFERGVEVEVIRGCVGEARKSARI